jgi:hypothetical protein
MLEMYHIMFEINNNKYKLDVVRLVITTAKVEGVTA